MNDFLAQLYSTNEIINPPSKEELEKQASAEFLCKLAADEGVDLNTLSDAQISELLQEVEKSASQQPQQPNEVDKEAADKMAEADFLGRAMAHAYVNELNEIEKEAGKAQDAYQAVKGALGKAGKAAGEWTGLSGIRSGARQRAAGKRLAQLGKTRGQSDIGVAAAERAGKAAAGKIGKGSEEMKAGLKRLGMRVGLPAAGLAAAGVGAKALGSEKKSYNEQIEELAQERAYQMLDEAGLLEKQASNDVELRALQLLEQAGYDVNWG